MKISGFKFKAHNVKRVPIVREDRTFYFVFEPLEGYEDFDALCPTPTPTAMGGSVGEGSKPIENTAYTEAKAKRWTALNNFVFLRSLKSVIVRKRIVEDYEYRELQSEGKPEWETVVETDPDTWGHWLEELKEMGLTNSEIALLRTTANEVNSISEAEVTKALDNFLAQEAEEVSLESIYQGGLDTIPPIELASDSESDPQE